VSEPWGEPPGGSVSGDEPSYAAAIDELEAILRQLEDDSLDVDRLGERVARAAFLIRLCRERIASAKVEVERVVADLDGPPAEA
jgi:exodeoxyribonuclease VII small subunit